MRVPVGEILVKLSFKNTVETFYSSTFRLRMGGEKMDTLLFQISLENAV